VKGLLKKRTSNIERPTSNAEWEKMKKQTYDIEERMLEHSVSVIKNDILEETEELTKIFVTSSKRLKRNRNSHSKFDIGFLKQMKFNCGAKRHHYSMFNVGRSMFDVHLLKQI